jgi:hypothetical protein
VARQNFKIEKGLHIVGENTDVGVQVLFGAGAPGSQTQENNAEVGSIYSDSTGGTAGNLYVKKSAGSGTDKWERIARYDDITALKWRSEKVIAITTQAAPTEGAVIDLVATPLTGDDTPFLVAANFIAGSTYILFGHGGTEVLGKVSAVSGDEITVTYLGFTALASGDTFVVYNDLIDSPDAQETQSIYLFNGTNYIRIASVNWQYATGIDLSAGYTPGSGNPTSADSVEGALQKIDGNVDALNTLSGVAQGATDLGTFTGDIISDNSTVKGALQELETDLDAVQSLTGVADAAVNLGTFTGTVIPDNQTIKQAFQSLESYVEGVQVAGSATAVTTAVTLDSVLVDNESAVEWFVKISLDSAPERVATMKIHALHNGTSSADATNVDDSEFGKIQLGSGFNYVLAVDINGTGAAQVMRLRLSASAAVSAKFIRRSIDF